METMRRLILESPRLLKAGMTIVIDESSIGKGLSTVPWLYPTCDDDIADAPDIGHALPRWSRCLVLSVHHSPNENWELKDKNGVVRPVVAHGLRRVFVLIGDEIGWVDYDHIKDVEL